MKFKCLCFPSKWSICMLFRSYWFPFFCILNRFLMVHQSTIIHQYTILRESLTKSKTSPSKFFRKIRTSALHYLYMVLCFEFLPEIAVSDGPKNWRIWDMQQSDTCHNQMYDAGKISSAMTQLKYIALKCDLFEHQIWSPEIVLCCLAVSMVLNLCSFFVQNLVCVRSDCWTGMNVSIHLSVTQCHSEFQDASSMIDITLRPSYLNNKAAQESFEQNINESIRSKIIVKFRCKFFNATFQRFIHDCLCSNSSM